MKLIYLTAKTYPSTTADHVFVRYMAEAFTRLLGDNFLLLVAGAIPDELQHSNATPVHAPKTFKTIFYFFWIPMFVMWHTHNTTETIFFSNDSNLLSISIFWKKLFGLKYQVVSDWHMLFGNWRDRFVSRNSTKLITTTKHFKLILSDHCNIPLNKIEAVYGGVDLELFKNESESQNELRARLGLSQSDILVGYVGFYKTMGMSKGLDTMINALNFIEDQKVKMVFVGGRDAEIEEYTHIARNAGVADRTLFIPAIPSDTVPRHEQAMDMLVIPYPDEPHFRDYGFPMKVYEYMASRRPIVYSNLPIIAEVLGDCATAFEPGNSKDLAEKISNLISDTSRSPVLVERAYAKVANYTWDKRAENILSFLRR